MRSEICYDGEGVADGRKLLRNCRKEERFLTCGKAASKPLNAEPYRMEEITGFKDSLL